MTDSSLDEVVKEKTFLLLAVLKEKELPQNNANESIGEKSERSLTLSWMNCEQNRKLFRLFVVSPEGKERNCLSIFPDEQLLHFFKLNVDGKFIISHLHTLKITIFHYDQPTK